MYRIFPRPDEIVQRADGFFDRRHRVESVQLIQVDVVGSQTFKAPVHRLGDVMPGGPHVVRPFAAAEGPFGRDQHLVTPASDGLAEDFFRRPAAVDVGRVEHRQPRLEADVDQLRRFDDVAAAPGFEEVAFASERAGPIRQGGHHQTGRSESAIFHGHAPVVGPDRPPGHAVIPFFLTRAIRLTRSRSRSSFEPPCLSASASSPPPR